MVLRLGFIVNPVAGIGGPAALKGSDGQVDAALARGYEPTADAKARRFLLRLKERAGPTAVRIFAAPGVMGADPARAAGWKVGTLGADTMLSDPFATEALDTEEACRYALEAEMDLVVFVGGDGTARDVAGALSLGRPMLGVPAGVKMFSDCFAETPEAAADLVSDIARSFSEGGEIECLEADVLDLDEDAYREGRMDVRHHGAARVPRSPRVQAAKCPACPVDGLEGAIGEIRLRMEANPEGLYLLGAGSTLASLKSSLGVDGALIGFDLVTGNGRGGWRLVASDADADTMDAAVAAAVAAGRPVTLVVSPIGGQGFIIGRGTGQLSPTAVRAALPDRVWVVASAGKMDTIVSGSLRVDTGDPLLDAAFPKFLRVVVGVERERMVKVARA